MSEESTPPAVLKLLDYLGAHPADPLPPAVVDWAFLEARRLGGGPVWSTLRTRLESVRAFLGNQPEEVDDKTAAAVQMVQIFTERVATREPILIHLLGKFVFPHVQSYRDALDMKAHEAGTLGFQSAPFYACPPWAYQIPPEDFPWESLHALIQGSHNALTGRMLGRSPVVQTPAEASLWSLFCDWIRERHGIAPLTSPSEVLGLHTTPSQ